MKRILVSVANALVLSGLVASAVLAAPGPGFHRTTSTLAGASAGQGAVVAKGAPCLVPVPGEPAGITTDSHSVVTPTGNVTLTCHTSGPRRGATFTGRVDEICFTPGGVTSGHLVATRSGRVNLSCHIHPHVPQSTIHSQAAEHRWRHGAVAGTGPHTTR